jgi:hypothetical protein
MSDIQEMKTLKACLKMAERRCVEDQLQRFGKFAAQELPLGSVSDTTVPVFCSKASSTLSVVMQFRLTTLMSMQQYSIP